jgi:hypothetical protein
MINRLLLVALILVVPSILRAQEKNATVDSLERCSAKLIPYAEWPKVNNPVFLLDLLSSSKGIYYFGARHSADPAYSQFLEIEKAWNKVKPTIAFYEGPNRPIAATRDETIKQGGESGFVRFLATRDGVQFVSLEPSPQDEATFVMQKFSPEQVKLFYVLREAASRGLLKRLGRIRFILLVNSVNIITARWENMYDGSGSKPSLVKSPGRTLLSAKLLQHLAFMIKAT